MNDFSISKEDKKTRLENKKIIKIISLSRQSLRVCKWADNNSSW